VADEVVAGERIDWDQVIDRSQANHLVLPVRGVLTRLAAKWRVPNSASDSVTSLRNACSR